MRPARRRGQGAGALWLPPQRAGGPRRRGHAPPDAPAVRDGGRARSAI